jgi:hypothetical protein
MRKGTSGITAQIQAEVSALEDFQLDDIIALGAPSEEERKDLGEKFDYFTSLYKVALKEQKQRQGKQPATE